MAYGPMAAVLGAAPAASTSVDGLRHVRFFGSLRSRGCYSSSPPIWHLEVFWPQDRHVLLAAVRKFPNAGSLDWVNEFAAFHNAAANVLKKVEVAFTVHLD